MDERTLTTYLLNLDDESFSAVYRNYLGPVQTPYNKHDLIQNLGEFLARSETVERIIALLDARDLILLSAVHVLGSPTTERLYRFLSSEYDYATFQTLLLNHKDRLLLIDGPRNMEVLINPVLHIGLAHINLGADFLVRGTPCDIASRGGMDSMPWLTPDFAVATYAFLAEMPDLFTRGGALRKRRGEELGSRFGSIADSVEVRFPVALQAFENLGLIYRSDEGTVVHVRTESWEAFTALPHRWVTVLLWAGAVSTTVEEAFAWGELLLDVISTLPLERAFTDAELVRLLQLSPNGLDRDITGDTVTTLKATGLFVPLPEEPERSIVSGGAATLIAMPTQPGGVRVQANLEVRIQPGTVLSEAFLVARIARLQRHDTVPTFLLAEESIAMARRQGIGDPLETLAKIAPELPQNVRFLLKRWETRSRAVRLLRGVVLTAETEEAELLKRSDDFSRLLQEELAAGVFLLREEDLPGVERLLERLDIGSSPAVESATVVDVDVPEYERFMLRYRQPMLRAHQPEVLASGGKTRQPETATGLPDSSPEAVKRELVAVLAGMSLSEDARQELALRIERGLILFPGQLRGEIIPQYGIEVRGLDYLGKIRMIEQAINGGDMLEVITRTGTGAPQRIMVRPRSVVQNGNDLMLRAIQEPEERPVKIRIRRISLLRRLSGTLISRSRRR